jgi:hypothetical protein
MVVFSNMLLQKVLESTHVDSYRTSCFHLVFLYANVTWKIVQMCHHVYAVLGDYQLFMVS